MPPAQELNSLESPSTQKDFQQLKTLVEQTAGSSERHKLVRQLAELEKLAASGKDISGRWHKWHSALVKNQQRIEKRRQNLPTIEYPDLPVSARAEEIVELIRKHQVIVIAGETGSGKTTQLPKICLQSGCGIRGLIGHTQPRRIAARTVANRIAEELKVPLGQGVGYQVRFSDQSSPNSYIKLMTDGILLAEIQNDRYLSKYDTLIIDEAHERSLNIDFLLGYLKTSCPGDPT